jgi:hypothetical protein
MVCTTFRIGNASGIIYQRGVRRRSCSVPGCSAPAAKQCDFKLSARRSGRTCDKCLCAAHAVTQSATTDGDTVDYCPAHADLVKGKP